MGKKHFKMKSWLENRDLKKKIGENPTESIFPWGIVEIKSKGTLEGERYSYLFGSALSFTVVFSLGDDRNTVSHGSLKAVSVMTSTLDGSL